MGAERETILVTGSSGLIGSAVVERFAGRYDAVGFDVKRPPGAERRLCGGRYQLGRQRPGRPAHAARAAGDRIASLTHLAAYHDFSGEHRASKRE